MNTSSKILFDRVSPLTRYARIDQPVPDKDPARTHRHRIATWHVATNRPRRSGELAVPVERLLRDPAGRRMVGDGHMNDAAPVMRENDEYEQQTERGGRHDEEVGGHDLAHVIREERPPRLIKEPSTAATRGADSAVQIVTN